MVTWSNQPSVYGTQVGSFSPGTGWRAYTVDLTDLVQDWVDGSATNYGIMLKRDTGGQLQCRSSDYGTPANRPKLTVDWHAREVTKYYHLGSQRVAMRVFDDIHWLHTDHPSQAQDYSLGSTSLLSDENGDDVVDSRIRYLPYGEIRSGDFDALPTDRGFTGHNENAYIELVFMKARWYSPQTGRFPQPDTIVPDLENPQDLNRYAYARNSPLYQS